MAQLNPYLSFPGNAREAMEFYKSVFGGNLTISTFAEYHINTGPDDADKVMHSVLDGDVIFMAADTPPGMEHASGSSISMSLSGQDESILRRYFDKLSSGGTVSMPLDRAPWGDTFGMVTDKFGVAWMVNVSAQS